MEIGRLIETIVAAATRAPGQFEKVSYRNGGGWRSGRMPESWVIAQIMNAPFDEGLLALPEVHVKNDLPNFESGGKPIHLDALRGVSGAKLDLCIGEHSIESNLIKLRVAVEVKGPKTSWAAFRRDIERLDEVRKHFVSEDQAIVFLYVSGPVEYATHLHEMKLLVRNTGLDENLFKAIPCGNTYQESGRQSYCYCYIERGLEVDAQLCV